VQVFIIYSFYFFIFLFLFFFAEHAPVRLAAVVTPTVVVCAFVLRSAGSFLTAPTRFVAVASLHRIARPADPGSCLPQQQIEVFWGLVFSLNGGEDFVLKFLFLMIFPSYDFSSFSFDLISIFLAPPNCRAGGLLQAQPPVWSTRLQLIGSQLMACDN